MALRFIADKSALARMSRPTVAARQEPLLLGGDVATCGVIELEILFSAKNHADLVRTRQLRKSLPLVGTSQQDLDRASKILDGWSGSATTGPRGFPISLSPQWPHATA